MLGNAIRKPLLPICLIAATAYGVFGLDSPLPQPEVSGPRKIERSTREVHAQRPLRRVERVSATLPPNPAASGIAASPAAGMVVARDPETGELGMPSPEQMRAIGRHQAMIVRNTPEGFTEIRKADGSVGLVLNGKLQSYSVARIGADGKPTTQCITAGSDSAALAAPAPQLEDR